MTATYKLTVTKIEPRDEESKNKMIAVIVEQNKEKSRYNYQEKSVDQIVFENDTIGIVTSKVLEVDLTTDEFQRVKMNVIKEAK